MHGTLSSGAARHLASAVRHGVLPAALMATLALLPPAMAQADRADPAHQSHLARLSAAYAVEKPAGDGPFPAVVLVPGCEGFARPLYRGRYERATVELKARGFVVARADYLAAIEASNCDLVMAPAEAAADVLATARHLQSLPFVKPQAVNVIGWSFGGGLALGMLEQIDAAAPRAVAAVVAYSPYLTLPRVWKADVPVLILCTLQDTVAPCDRTDALLAQLPGGLPVRHLKLPEGLHAFDNADVTPGPNLAGRMVGYHEATAKTAWAEVLGFLRR